MAVYCIGSVLVCVCVWCVCCVCGVCVCGVCVWCMCGVCFKRILKFTIKQLLHVSVQSPSSGSVLFELGEVIIIKIIS